MNEDEKEPRIIRLCSNWEPRLGYVCDKPEGHKGPHEARVIWGDEDADTDDR